MKSTYATKVKLKPDQWIEVKYQGRTYIVAVGSLLKAWQEKQDDK